MFPKKDWKGTPYPQNEDCLKEEIPENAPEPRGNGMIVSAFVGSDHAGCKVTRRSRTGFLYICSVPLYIGLVRSKEVLRLQRLDLSLSL